MLERFITFEGGEGVGKTTQIRRLAKRLEDRGEKVLVTREPGGSPCAEALRHVLLSGAAKAMGSDAEAILFAAARADHVSNTIKPALDRSAWVLCDRFVDSTRVYQGLAGVPAGMLLKLEEIATDGIMPGLTIILDIPATHSLKRIQARAENTPGGGGLDRFETEPIEVHRKRRAAFLNLAKDEPKRCQVVAAVADADDVEQRIWQLVSDWYKLDDETSPLQAAISNTDR